MPQIVKLPDGRRLNFPDGMSQDDMSAAIAANFPEFAPPATQPEADPIEEGPIDTQPPIQQIEPQRQSTPAAMERMRQAQEQEAAQSATREALVRQAETERLINPPKPLGEVAVEAVKNIPSSGAQLAKDVTMPIRHPIQTAKGVGALAKGLGQKLTPGEQPEEQIVDDLVNAMVERYGGIENIKATVAKDPVGILSDIASVLVPAGGVAAKAGRAIEPVSMAAKTAKKTASKLIPEDLPGKLYESAVKFRTTIPESDRLKMVNTALENSIMPTVGGLDKTRNIIGDLNTQITTMIDQATTQGKKIPVRDLFKEFDIMKKELSGDPLLREAQINRIEKSLKTYFKDLGKKDLTPQEAQKLKQRIYKETESFYSSVKESPAKIEAKQAVARAAKEGLEDIFPEIKQLNKKEGSLIALKKELERASSRISNRDLIGIGVPIKGGAGGAIGGPAGMAIGVVAGLLDTPTVKAKLAIVANRLKRKGIVLPEDSIIRQILEGTPSPAVLRQAGIVERTVEEQQ